MVEISEERLAALEDRVADLEGLAERVDALEAALTAPAVVDDGPTDRYDAAMLERLREADGAVRVDQLHTWYRRAGVKSEPKIKRRLRDLHDAGLIDRDGRRWRYAGERADGLEGVA